MASPIQLESTPLRPGRLWSLLDMLKVTAQEYIDLGREISNTDVSFAFAHEPSAVGAGG